MALVIRHTINLYWTLNNEYDDKRVKEWLFMSNPFKAIAIIGLYLLFVLRWGPKFMEKRQPFKLDKIIKCYNLSQVAICAYITVEAYRYTFARGYNLFCQPVDYSMDPDAYRIAQIGHYYFLTKVVDLLDTIFFILKKKNSHVSFLHVYHHAGMVALTWMGTKYFAGGHSVFTGWINSFVHVIMYFYYFLTSIDAKYKQSSWKKYITQLQMIQFGLMALHWLFLRLSSDCGFPKFLSFFMLPQNAFIFILFYDFYRKTYGDNVKQTSVESKNKIDSNNNADTIDISRVKGNFGKEKNLRNE